MREEGPPPKQADDWLPIANAADGAARLLVRFCLEQASVGDVAELKRWVSLAPRIDPANQHADVALVAALAGASADDRDHLPDGGEDRLRDHLEMLTVALQDLRSQLGVWAAEGILPMPIIEV